ncbi:MAG: phosphotransferase [Caldilineaceae bacterium]
MQLDRTMLQEYLSRRHGAQAEIRRVQQLRGEVQDEEALKQFSYGDPVLIEYTVDGQHVREVLHRIRRTPFGRERSDDRVAAIWLDYQTFNKLPRHVPAADILAHLTGNGLTSLASADELMLVTGYRPGHVYADDLIRLRDGGDLRDVDVARAEALAAYLAEIHLQQHDDPALWRRRLRDLVGHGEGVMGLTDSYPADFALADRARLRRIEEAVNGWRWRLKEHPQRLAQVHGDFHPFNILFDTDSTFFVLDRSRGAWGEPADDVSCLTINYIFFALQQTGTFGGAFRTLYDRFWETYTAARPDPDLTAVIQPWFAWRALVVASPIWYPSLEDDVRRKLLDFCENVLAAPRFDVDNPARYWQDAT